MIFLEDLVESLEIFCRVCILRKKLILDVFRRKCLVGVEGLVVLELEFYGYVVSI